MRGNDRDPDAVTIVLSQLAPGGSQRAATNLANLWAQQGRAVSLITLTPDHERTYHLDDGVERHCLGYNAPYRGIARAFDEFWHFLHLSGVWRAVVMTPKLRRSIKKAGAPVVVSFIRATNVKVILASRGLGLRVVVSERNDPARQRKSRFWDPMSRMFYRFADMVTANSRGALNALAEFVPRGKLAYVPNLLLPPTALPDGVRRGSVLLAVGRLVPQKGYHDLLSAFAKAHRSMPDWRLVVLGDGPLRGELEELAETLGVAENIEWLGYVENPYPYYCSADIFIMASLYEGTPNALIEAMHCGLPSIVTASSPGPLELIRPGNTGMTVGFRDCNGLAKAIVQLARDPGLRQRLGKAAQSRVEEFQAHKAMPVWDSVISV